MNMVKGIYHDGIVEPIEKLKTGEFTEVIIIFPEQKKSVNKIGGLFKDYEIDFKQVSKDLKKLSQKSEKHIIEKLTNE